MASGGRRRRSAHDLRARLVSAPAPPRRPALLHPLRGCLVRPDTRIHRCCEKCGCEMDIRSIRYHYAQRFCSRACSGAAVRVPREFVEATSSCILWIGARSKCGYGRFAYRSGGRLITVLAHRHAYASAHGEIPHGLLVRHKCDVKLCVNPEHLEVGTKSDNTLDWSRRQYRVCRRGHAVEGPDTELKQRCRKCHEMNREQQKVYWHEVGKYKRVRYR